MKFFNLNMLVFLLLITGCVSNPVTGKHELSLISEQQEIAIGDAQYKPSRQSQGGDYTLDPALTAYVNKVGQRLVAVSDRQLPYEFKVLNNSIPNAWAMPGGKIAINRGLLIHLKSEAELAAVLGHEIVHAAAKHGVRQMSKGMLLQGAVVGTALATQGSDYGNVAQLGASLGAQLISQKYGRDDERESDQYGMLYMSRAGYNPQGAVDLQRTFVKLSQGRKQDWLSGMFSSHPPSQERVNNNLAELAKLPQGGEMGVERYQLKIAKLIQTQAAYEAYDQGRKNLAKGDGKSARSLADKAIAIEPEEAHFYALKGDVEQQNNKLNQSLTYYNKAITLNPDFFYYYLQRGLVKEKQNKLTIAQQDLEQSHKLLPTAGGLLALGNVSRKLGQIEKAKGYYTKIAEHKSDAGKQAYEALVELDLSSNPDKYLAVNVGKNANGQLVAQVANPTPKKVGGVTIAIQYKSVSGQVFQMNKAVGAPLMADDKQLVSLGLSASQVLRIQAKVTAAHIITK